MSSRRSQRMRRRFMPWYQEMVRSTTHLCLPRLDPCGWPRRRSARTTAGYPRPRSGRVASSPDGHGQPGSDRFWATPRGPDMREVDHRPRPIQLPGTLQLSQQQLVQLLPDTDPVPLLQPAPAGHPGPEPQLLRQELPLDPGVPHEQDPTQHLPIRDPLPTRIPQVPRRWLGQQRLDALPQPGPAAEVGGRSVSALVKCHGAVSVNSLPVSLPGALRTAPEPIGTVERPWWSSLVSSPLVSSRRE